MDKTKFEKFYNAVRILIIEQKVQSKKISELENKINITGNFNQDLNDEKKETDKRFDSVIDRFEIILATTFCLQHPRAAYAFRLDKQN